MCVLMLGASFSNFFLSKKEEVLFIKYHPLLICCVRSGQIYSSRKSTAAQSYHCILSL